MLLDDVSMAKKIAIKRIRARARLEASIKADLVLNEIEDEFLTEFDRRVAAGLPYELESFDGWVTDAVNARFEITEGS